MQEPPFQVLPPGPPQPKKPFFQNLWGVVVAGGIAALKYGFLVLKSLKTVLSMAIMIWIYSWFFGWPFAVGIVFMLLVHEMGHVVAGLLLGIPVSTPMFIPFFAAYVTMKEAPRDAWTEALFACGGPFAGAVGSWICLAIGLQYNLLWVIAVASTSFVFNLFGMIPVPPFDGGRICAAVSRSFWLLGLVLLGLALIYFHSLVTSLIIIAMVFFMTLPRIQASLFDDSEEARQYYELSIPSRLTMAFAYLSMIFVLLLGYWAASSQLRFLWETQKYS